MTESTHVLTGDFVQLKQRVAQLTSTQRAELARRLKTSQSKPIPPGRTDEIPKAKPLRVEQPSGTAIYPASPGQQRMWFLYQYAPDSPVYNVVSAFHLVGELNPAWLKSAFQAVIDQNDTLRTTFAMEDAILVQRVSTSLRFQLPIVDLGNVPTVERKSAADKCLSENARLPFDLKTGPLFRGVLVRLQADEHVLLLVMHHVISDGWSRSNFHRALSEVYTGLASGRPSVPNQLPLQYADYAAWHKSWLDSGALAEQIDYWKAKLADEPDPLELPADRPRPPTDSFQGACCVRLLAPELIAALKTRAQEEGATLFMILLSGFNTLLRRYTGKHDFCVGVPIANRQHAAVERNIGFFANTLVLRTCLEGDPTFREFLRTVKTAGLEAYAHQDLPFERLMELTQGRRDAGSSRLFRVGFAVQDYPAAEFTLPQINASPWFVTTNTCKFDLSLALEPSSKGWRVVVEYSTDLFNGDRVERMLDHWSRILESIAENPDQRLSRIPMLSPAERHLVLVKWNQTERDYPRDKSIDQLFHEQAEQSPETIAVVAEGGKWTYRELNERANHLARQLRDMGVGPEVIVGVAVERSLEMMATLLGILKAGGAYWGLEPNAPEERLKYMIEDARPGVVVTSRRSSERLVNVAQKTTGAGVKVAIVEDLMELPVTGARLAFPAPDASRAAYVSYTSGSTGRPKGVVVPHRAVVRLVRNTNYATLSSQETLLQVSPLAFDASTFEIWGALLSGGQLVLMPPGPPGPAEIGNAIRRYNVTTLWLTGGLFHLMVDTRLDELKPLRQLLAGGDVLSPERVRKARAALPDCRIVNGYGPTENTTFTCCYDVREESEFTPSVPIGQPIANSRVYVLDNFMQPVPPGVPGELYAGGDGVARGYLNQPELTAQRFVPDPFSPCATQRLYRTGDLARWRLDGNLEYLGRLDSQVKIRGFRIELGEIENALAAHPNVASAAVAIKQDVPADKRLMAYLVPRANARLSPADLRRFLLQKIPDYMVPSDFWTVEHLPLTTNGKIDRQALVSLEKGPASMLPSSNGSEATGRLRNGVSRADNEAVPSSDVQSKLLEIWGDVLGRTGLRLDDDFFELGGHSLLAVIIQARIEKEFGKRLPLAAFFKAVTVRAQSELIAGLGTSNHGVLFPGCARAENKPPLICLHHLTAAQSLAKYLAPDWPVFGIELPLGEELRKWYENRQLELTLEELAARNLEIIQRVQPTGPYFLAGFCFGGVLAFEVARQLQRKGQQVELLALLDARYRPGLRTLRFSSLRRWLYHATRVYREGGGYLLKRAQEKAAADARRKAALQALQGNTTQTNNPKLKEVRLLQEEFLGQLLEKYLGGTYSGKALLVRALEWPRSLKFDLGETSGWNKVVEGKLEIQDLRCDHDQIGQEPWISEVARLLKPRLPRPAGI